MMITLLIGVLFTIQCPELVSGQNPVVETEVGTIRGSRAKDGNYSTFVRIPYARVNPDNVFGAALPYPRFQGIYDAIGDISMCPQLETLNKTFIGSLDCLHINVFVPDAVNASRPLAVMVFIYGGAFRNGFLGNWMFGPKFFMRHDVILVMFSYRTGPYGFFCIDTPDILGNQGMKDQILALRWVQQNIRGFGGDPKRVTIFGNSSGAVSVDLHLISNFEPLFQNVIIQSGSAYSPGLIRQDDSSGIRHLAAYLGHETSNTTEALRFLNGVKPELLITAFETLNIGARPCLESSKYPDVPTFLTNFPVNINKSWKNITVLMGVVDDERLADIVDMEHDGKSYKEILSVLFQDLYLGFNFNETLFAELKQIIRNFYIGDRDLDIAVKHNLVELSSDIFYYYQALRRIQKYLDNDVDNIFFYLFNYEGGRNFGRKLHNITEPGVTHADDIGYLFYMDYFPEPVTPADQLIMDRLTTMWTNFAQYGNPTPEITSLLPVKWEPITKDSATHYLTINTELTFNHSFHHERMSFWHLIYKAYAEYEQGYGFVPSYSSAASVFNSLLLCVVIVLEKLFYLVVV